MIRILCILSNMNLGGAETFLMKMFRAMDRDKVVFDFCINIEEKNAYEDEITALGGRVYRIPLKTAHFVLFCKELYRLVKQNEYHYILRITSTAVGFIDVAVARRAGARFCAVRSSNSSDGDSKLALLLHKLCRALFLKQIDLCLAPSDKAAIYTFGENYYRSGKVHILKNALDLSVYRYDQGKRAAIRKQFGLKEDQLVIGHVGRFDTQKNHSFLIDIFERIHRNAPDSVLMLVGNGELEAAVQEKARKMGLEKAVIFCGEQKDVVTYYSAMDVFVFPSFFEGMPNTVIEAQATGLPCVISNTITQECNLTDLVTFLSLSDSPDVWASKSIENINHAREKSTADSFKKNGYDIVSCTQSFVKLMIGDQHA